MRNLVLKNQVVFGTVNARANAYGTASENLARFMQRWPEAVRGLITGRFPIEQHLDLLTAHVAGIKNTIQLA